jgi:uncharacterized protein
MDLNWNTLEVRHNPAEQRFEVTHGDDRAEIDYRMEENVIIFVHTEVPAAWGGKGIGERMAQMALDYARAQGHLVLALCPFVAAYIKRHPAYQDITIDYPG